MGYTKGPLTISPKALCTHNAPMRFWETAIASPVGFVGIGIGATEEESQANAKLYAAAPEMYEALLAITEGMEASGGWIGDEELFAQGISAIAKAEGKAQP